MERPPRSGPRLRQLRPARIVLSAVTAAPAAPRPDVACRAVSGKDSATRAALAERAARRASGRNGRDMIIDPSEGELAARRVVPRGWWTALTQSFSSLRSEHE